MTCPNDNSVMEKVSKEGITIDHCTTCHGVWLDRGELDKIIEIAEERAEDKQESKDELQAQKQYPDIREGFVRRSRRGFLGDLFNFTGA